LSKSEHEEKKEKMRILLEKIHELEAGQCDLRKKVRIALANRDASLIKSLSWSIFNNRRKPSGLRDLNKAVFNFWQ